jgi:predicted Zn-dependent protease
MRSEMSKALFLFAEGKGARFLPAGLARRVPLVVMLAASVALSSCQSIVDETNANAIGPSTKPQVFSEAQKNDPNAAMGAREHPRILATYGGEYNDEKTEKLVARIAGSLTAVSENPKQSYRITILNSPAINAFALPGGYLYVTRGLLALANDASEVAAVLAHEMAHVTANHGILRQQKEEAEQIASQVVSEVLQNDAAGQQAIARGKLRLAAFSRNQELQADEIGVRMLGEAGYDPYAAARFLTSMENYSRFTAVNGEDQSLDFLSSHPSAPQRVELARQHARAFGQEGTVGDKGRDYYLSGIDGLLFGDSPKEGYVRGTTFLHANLGIRFDVPDGFQIDNKAEAVLATGPGDIAVRFDGVSGQQQIALTDYIASGWVTGLDPASIRATKINGMDAAIARASAQRWDFDVTVIRSGTQIYRFLTAVPKDDAKLEQVAGAIRESFRRMTPNEVASLKPLRVRVITAGPKDTVETLSSRMMGTDRKPDLFRLLNAMTPFSPVRPGDKFKIISE